MMLMKQLKLHMKFHYKAILIFWIVALLIKGTTSAADLNGIKVGFLQDILNNPSIAITFFIVVSTFIIQDEVFRLVVSFGVTRLQFFVGAVCYITLQAVVFSSLQLIFLQNIVYSSESARIGGHSLGGFFAQFLFYVTIASFFQVVVIFKQRFQWIGLAVGGTIFLGVTSVLYGEVGIRSFMFINSETLIDVPYFIMISMGLTVVYIIVSSILIRKVSFEQMI